MSEEKDCCLEDEATIVDVEDSELSPYQAQPYGAYETKD